MIAETAKETSTVSMTDSTQQSRYREHGYLVVEHALTPEELEALRRRTREISEGRVSTFPAEHIELEPGAERATSATVRKLTRCAAHDPVLSAHAGNERILDLVESLIGPDIKIYDSQCFMKPPGGIEKPWHQDSAYFPIEPLELVTCWTALDDVTLENGCMWVIPGSHRQGVLDHSQAWRVGDRVDKQVPDGALEVRDEVPIVMPAGSCSFHHSLLVHRSGPNRSHQPRRGLAVHYMSARSRWTAPDRPQPEYPLVRGRAHDGCV